MKKLFISTIAVLFILSSAFAQKSNGKLKTETRTVSSYDKIMISGYYTVELVSGEEGKIDIKGKNAKDIANVKVEVDGQTLKISAKEKESSKNYKNNPIYITIPVTEVNAVALNGSGDVRTKDLVLKSSGMQLSLMGSGDMDIAVESARLIASITGSGDLNIKGTSNYLQAKVKGSGDLDANLLESNIVDATVTGSGDVEVVAHKSISASVTGSGDVEYSGNPAVEKIKTTGSGDIFKK
ncbi:MAG: hypothetical protein ACI94Y_000050 [Maribacter sp.]|jgi:hypothetical protein